MAMHTPSFHGNVLRTSEWSDFRVTEVAYPPRLKTPRHTHEYAYIGIVREGGSTQSFGNRVRRWCPISVIFHPAGESHSDTYQSRPSLEVNVEIAPAKLGQLLRTAMTSARPLPSAGSGTSRLAQILYREFCYPGELSVSTLEGVIAELLAAVVVQDDGTAGAAGIPEWLKEAKLLIACRFREYLTLPELAIAVGRHPVHLAREFQRQYGRTIGEEIRWLRVGYACRRVLNGEPLAEVALDAGFCDQSHFTRVFKNTLGITPLNFRNDNDRRFPL